MLTCTYCENDRDKALTEKTVLADFMLYDTPENRLNCNYMQFGGGK